MGRRRWSTDYGNGGSSLRGLGLIPLRVSGPARQRLRRKASPACGPTSGCMAAGTYWLIAPVAFVAMAAPLAADPGEADRLLNGGFPDRDYTGSPIELAGRRAPVRGRRVGLVV